MNNKKKKIESTLIEDSSLKLDNDKAVFVSSTNHRSSYLVFNTFINTEIHVGKDGHLFLVDKEDGEAIYLYPEQVKHLKKILRSMK